MKFPPIRLMQFVSSSTNWIGIVWHVYGANQFIGWGGWCLKQEKIAFRIWDIHNLFFVAFGLLIIIIFLIPGIGSLLIFQNITH